MKRNVMHSNSARVSGTGSPGRVTHRIGVGGPDARALFTDCESPSTRPGGFWATDALLRVFAAAVLLTTAARASEPIKPAATRTVLGGIVTLLLPADFTQQSAKPDDARSGPRDEEIVAYSTAQGAVLGLGFDGMKLKTSEIPTLVEANKAMYRYTRITFAGVKRINDTDFAVIEADVPAPDGKISHRMIEAETSWSDRRFVVSYMCEIAKDAACADRGRQIVESIRLSAPPAAK
jgi:hypothetical protein